MVLTRQMQRAVLVAVFLAVTSTACSQSTNETTLPTPANTIIPPQAVERVMGIDIEITSAVAPYDHDTNADAQRLERWLAIAPAEEINACLEDKGFPQPPVVYEPLPRDDPMLAANLDFPDSDRLLTTGFPITPLIPAVPSDFEELPADVEYAFQVCGDELAAKPSPASRALFAFGDLMAAWLRVLEEIDARDDVRAGVADTLACLHAQGVPSTVTTLGGFFTFVDMKVAEVADPERIEAVQRKVFEEYGKLYAECGQDLFALKERLRSGEARTEFLRTHRAAIEDLQQRVYGTP